MSRTPMSRRFGAWIIGMILCLSPLAFAQAANPYELIQIHASRAVGSLVLYRGEGMQNIHAKRIEGDRGALHATLAEAREQSTELRTALTEQVRQMRLGRTYNRTEAEVP